MNEEKKFGNRDRSELPLKSYRGVKGYVGSDAWDSGEKNGIRGKYR